MEIHTVQLSTARYNYLILLENGDGPPWLSALQLSSRDWLDPIPDPILPENFCGKAGNRTRDLFDGSQTC